MSGIPPHTDMEAGVAPVNRKAPVLLWIFIILAVLIAAGVVVLTVFFMFFPTIWNPQLLNGWQEWVNYVRLCGAGVFFLAGIFAIIVMGVLSMGPGAVITASILVLLGAIACIVTFVFDLIDYAIGDPTCTSGLGFFGFICFLLLIIVLRKRRAQKAQVTTIKVGKSKEAVKEEEKRVSVDVPVKVADDDKQKEVAQKELSSLKPYLGLSLRDSENEEGVKVSDVKSDGPAQAAGVKVGDDILAVDGMDCDDNDEFKTVMKEAAPGEEMTFAIERGKKKLDIVVRFGAAGLTLEKVVELRRLAGVDFCKELDESGAKRIKEMREKNKVDGKGKKKAAPKSPSVTRQTSKKAMRRQASKGDKLRTPRQASKKSFDEDRDRDKKITSPEEKRKKEEQVKKAKAEAEEREKKEKELAAKKKEEAAKQREAQEKAEDKGVSEADREAARDRLRGMKSSLGLGLKDGPARGALISRVKEGQAADRSGLKKGDIVLMVGDIEVDDNDDFKMVMREAAPGEEEVFVVKRDGKEIKVPVQFGGAGGVFFSEVLELRELAGKQFCEEIDGAGADAIKAQKSKKNETVSDEDRQAAQDRLMKLKSSLGMGVQDGPDRGARIGQVKGGMAASRAGLKSGDIIIDVEGDLVNSMADFKSVCMKAAPGETCEFSIERDGKEYVIPVVFGCSDSSMTIEDVLELRRVAGREFCVKMDLERGE